MFAPLTSLLLVGCPDDTATTMATTGLPDTTDGAATASTGVTPTTTAPTTEAPTTEAPATDTTDTTDTTSGGASVCGNGVVEPGEACDDGDGVDGDACTNQCTLAECGDGVVGPGEVCDDGDGNGPDGPCSAVCQLVAGCGDGKVDPGEQCDDGPDNADIAACTAACMHNICGDGKVGPGEGCDDGNDVDRDECSDCALTTCGDGEHAPTEQCDDGDADDTDDCTSTCTLATCSDGFLQPGVGEACDDGPDNADDAACTTTCQQATCGDGHTWALGGEGCDNGAENGPGAACNASCELNVCGDGDPGPAEACDDGNLAAGDGCSATCELEGCGNAVVDPPEQCDDGQDGDDDDGCTDACKLPVCGDGLVQPSLAEQCDLGGANSNSGACTLACKQAACGDGLVFAASEQCDDGPGNGAGKACKADCKLNVCGDGDKGPGEGCDDGNASNLDGCTNVCSLSTCGDGFVQPGEQCDKGAGNGPGLACKGNCTHNVCGDGDKGPGEECDDGNLQGGDGCLATCEIGCANDSECAELDGPCAVGHCAQGDCVATPAADGVACDDLQACTSGPAACTNGVCVDLEGTAGRIYLKDVRAGLGGFAIELPWQIGGASEVALLRDFNGDGLADIAIGDANFQANTGQVLVAYGKTDTAPISIFDIIGDGGFTIECGPYVNVGRAVADGNIDGDAYSDLLFASGNGSTSPAYSYVLLGSPSQGSFNVYDLYNGFKIHPDGANPTYGRALAAGDVNNDGLDDIVVANLSHSLPNKLNIGRTSVVYGKPNILPVQLSQVANGVGGFAIDGAKANDFSGEDVDVVGDVNGDGYGDVVITHSGLDDTPLAYVVFGKPNNLKVELSAVANGAGGFRVIPEGVTPLRIRRAGDVNGDGLADIILSDQRLNVNIGRAYVVFGKPTTTTVQLSDVAAGIGGFMVTGFVKFDDGGLGISGVGDLNQDGLDDVVVTARMASAPERAFVVFGKKSTAPVQIADLMTGQGGFVIEAESNGGIGEMVDGRHDVNGDGIPDLLLGPARYGQPDNYTRVFVVFGGDCKL